MVLFRIDSWWGFLILLFVYLVGVPIALTMIYFIIIGLFKLITLPIVLPRNVNAKKIISKLEEALSRITARNEQAGQPKQEYILKRDKLDTLRSEFAKIISLAEEPIGDVMQTSLDIPVLEKVSRFAGKEFRIKAFQLENDILSQEGQTLLFFSIALQNLLKEIRAEEAGVEGEEIVLSKLNEYNEYKEYKVIAGLTIKIDEHKYRETDLVVITQSGIFVAEIKNWHGGLFVAKDGLFVLNGNVVDSPVHQNMEHIKCNRKLIIEELKKLGQDGTNIPFYPMIVIANDELGVTNESDDILIIRASALTNYLYQNSNVQILTNEQQQQLYDIFIRNNDDSMKVPYNSYVEEMERLLNDINYLNSENRLPDLSISVKSNGTSYIKKGVVYCYCQTDEDFDNSQKIFNRILRREIFSE